MSGGFFRPECEEMSSSVWSLLPRSWKQVHAGSLVLNFAVQHSSSCLECFEQGTGTTKIVGGSVGLEFTRSGQNPEFAPSDVLERTFENSQILPGARLGCRRQMPDVVLLLETSSL